MTPQRPAPRRAPPPPPLEVVIVPTTAEPQDVDDRLARALVLLAELGRHDA
jgi:hypothetical protein